MNIFKNFKEEIGHIFQEFFGIGKSLKNLVEMQ